MVQTAGLCRGQVSKENQVFDKGDGGQLQPWTRGMKHPTFLSSLSFFLKLKFKVLRTDQFCPHHLTVVRCHG